VTTYDFSPDPDAEMAALQAEVKRLMADHDAQRRELQARNTELVEARRALAVKLDETTGALVRAETILSALVPSQFLDAWILPRLWVLSQEAPIRNLLDELMRRAVQPAVKEKP